MNNRSIDCYIYKQYFYLVDVILYNCFIIGFSIAFVRRMVTMSFVEWCNANSGFTSAILSIVGLTLSVIAIVISIYTAKLPYKKRLLINIAGAGIIEEDEMGHVLEITNLGNRPVYIVKMGFMVGEIATDRIKDIELIKDPLLPKQSISTFYSLDDLVALVHNSSGKKIYGFVEDSERKRYKKYLMRVSELQKLVKQ